jgi:hypothetical protein
MSVLSGEDGSQLSVEDLLEQLLEGEDGAICTPTPEVTVPPTKKKRRLSAKGATAKVRRMTRKKTVSEFRKVSNLPSLSCDTARSREHSTALTYSF